MSLSAKCLKHKPRYFSGGAGPRPLIAHSVPAGCRAPRPPCDAGIELGYSLVSTTGCLWSVKHPPLAPIGNNVLLGEKVKVTGPSLIEDNVSIGKGSQIGPYAVLKRDATLGEEVIIENASIFEGAKVGSYDKIRGSIIGEQANLAERVVVDGSIIGPGSTLEQSVEVKSGSRIWPGIRVAAAVRLIHRTIRLPTDNPFYFNSDVGKFTGLTATTIGDLADELERVEVRSIEFHLEKGDFERWIRNIFQVDTLAERISDLRGHGLQGEVLRKEFISIVRTWLRYSTESN